MFHGLTSYSYDKSSFVISTFIAYYKRPGKSSYAYICYDWKCS